MRSVRKLDPTKEALGYIRDLEPKQFKQVMNKVLSLLENPSPADSILLKGHTDLYRTDIGEHRIVYRFDDKNVWLYVVAKRNDGEVYKQVERKKL
jgi:mRNA interferase RelE/StbE